MSRARTVAGNALYWLLPLVVCLVVHWAAFQSWFRADDFAWLSLDQHVFNFQDALRALFAPQAQGTIRPWSDRGLFMLGYVLFGLDALPYRIIIFATEFASLALMASIVTRLTGRRAAGLWAALLWSVNTSSVQPLGWVCVYNEVMCAFFLLLAFHLLLRHIETGARRYYIYQWVVFVLGFGALEINVVYPLLAALYALFCARKYLRKTLAMVPVSVAYSVLHMIVAPVPKSGVYAMHLDGSMLRTLGIYWTWSLGPAYLAAPFHLRRWIPIAAIVLLSLALLTFAVRQIRAGKPVAAFFLLWFPLVLAPELPLRDHLTEYYPFLPTIGLSWLAGWGIAAAWQSGAAAKTVSHFRPIAVRAGVLALVAVYVLLVIPRTLTAARWNRDLTLQALHLVQGVAGARQLHPEQTILLDGVDGALFWNAIYPGALRLAGIHHVYLTPQLDPELKEHPDWGEVTGFVLSGAVMAAALDRDQVEVYDVRGPRLRNVTAKYAELPRSFDLPRQLDLGSPLVSDLLGPEWYGLETDHRWMPARATVRIGGPVHSGQSLRLKAICTGQQLEAGPVTVGVTVDGAKLPPATVSSTGFEVTFPIPDALVGKPEIRVAIEVSRVARFPGDPRDLGLAFGEIAVD